MVSGDTAGGESESAAAERIASALVDIGFPPSQAEAMAAALATQPQAAAAFAQMPLTDLLRMIPPGALTRDIFHIGHEPGWFFDKWYATGQGNGGYGQSVAGEGASDDGGRAGAGGGGVAGTGVWSGATGGGAIALRSGFEFALPLEGYANGDDRKDEQDAKYRAFGAQFTDMLREDGAIAREGKSLGVRVLHAGGGISEDEATALVLSDLRFATAAFALVFACVIGYTRSLWTTVNALLGIALSFPTAFFFFRLLSASPFVSFLNMLVPFVLLGIGCDDAMVMCDAFAAASDREGCVDTSHRRRPLLPPEDLFISRYVSAARAMLATSLTTAVAFGSNVFSFIPPVRALGAGEGGLTCNSSFTFFGFTRLDSYPTFSATNLFYKLHALYE